MSPKYVLPSIKLGQKVSSGLYFDNLKNVIYLFLLEKGCGSVPNTPEKCLVEFLENRTTLSPCLIVFVSSVEGTTGDYHIVVGIDINYSELLNMSKTELVDRYFWKDLPYKYTIRDMRIGTDREFI